MMDNKAGASVFEENRNNDTESGQVAVDDVLNPLRNLSEEVLLQNVALWHAEKELPPDTLDLFKRGAQVAQNPNNLDRIEGLTGEERSALLREETKIWNHPKPLYYTIIISSLAAAIQGWDQACSPCEV
ncbi:hypothetical protein CSOJ01_08895 [Colletotrichum sojae]|uniref:Uncharacterized protein n=1 Tax=Colletotrichum sojae TaxID=2175907 RepID=A0A8H6J4G6_9PEZI|nr:hypothetical protein CSOJ01_08895 [Colletotrichum sojae]